MDNLSSKTLLATEKEVLARGLNFASAPKRIPGALSKNGYSTVLVKRNRQPSPHEPTSIPEPDTYRIVVVIPYIQHLSESIRRILSPLGIRTYF